MLHAKFCGNQTIGSGEEFLRVFTIYDQDAANKLLFPLPKEAPYKIWL